MQFGIQAVCISGLHPTQGKNVKDRKGKTVNVKLLKRLQHGKLVSERYAIERCIKALFLH